MLFWTAAASVAPGSVATSTTSEWVLTHRLMSVFALDQDLQGKLVFPLFCACRVILPSFRTPDKYEFSL